MYNLFNKFLSDISALLLHICVQLRQPWLKQPKTVTVKSCTTCRRLKLDKYRIHGLISGTD